MNIKPTIILKNEMTDGSPKLRPNDKLTLNT